MRSDLLSKRLYIAGWFGLPWLWIVHALYWQGNDDEKSNPQNNNEGLLNPDDHFPEDSRGTEASVEDIKREALCWVRRCRVSATLVVTLWMAWIVTSQIFYHNGKLPSSWFMLNNDDAGLTGW